MTRSQIAAFLLFLACLPCAAAFAQSSSVPEARDVAVPAAALAAAPAGCASSGLSWETAPAPLYTAAKPSQVPTTLWIFTLPQNNADKGIECSCGGNCSGPSGCTCLTCGGCSFGGCLSCCFSGCASNCH